MEINPYIFRGYDIRGIFEKDLNEYTVTQIGKGYGTYILQHGKKEVIVGMDCRDSSPVIKKWLIDALILTGVNVIDIGMVLTPIYYFARELYDIEPGIMITASHNPPEYNGFKMSTYGKERLATEKLQEFRHFVEEGNFIQGNGSVEEKSPINEYVSMLKEKIQLGNRKIKVVVDCGNGTASIVAERVFNEIGCKVIPIYCAIDPTYPHHLPDPSVIENMQDLIAKVKEESADLGIGFDGDGDRMCVVDNNGRIILGDEIQIIMAREILPKNKGVKMPVEVKCTYALYEEIEKLGGVPFYHPTGNAYFYNTVKIEHIPFAGEMSGHLFFADEYYGYDDGVYAACRFIRLLSNTEKKASELLENINRYYITPEIKIAEPDEIKFELVEKVKQYFKENTDYTIVDVDGIRIVSPEGWGLLRASNTSPYLVLRTEGKTEEVRDRIKEEIQNVLNKVS